MSTGHVFYNLDEDLGSRISPEAVTGSGNVAIASAPVASYAVVPSWIEDFRTDVEAVRRSGKPALILHGTADRILPIDATAAVSPRHCPTPTTWRSRAPPRAALDARRRRQRRPAHLPRLARGRQRHHVTHSHHITQKERS